MFRSTTHSGYSTAISQHPERVLARKRPSEVQVQFASQTSLIQTREGQVHARLTDAILTGAAGERWVVPCKHFAEKYRAVPPTVDGQEGRYVSLPYSVMAVPMSGEFEVLLADGLSTLQGQAGDWLVDYGDGSLGIVSQAIFPTTYDIVS
jgi:PGDYG protein